MNGINHKSKNKSDGYDLIDGSKDTAIGIKPTPKGQKSTPSPNYSTVSFVRCNAVVVEADCFFHFTISQRTPLLQMSLYSEYQYFLYETISELRDKEMTFNQIADELNRQGYLSARGKVFKDNHIH